MSAEFESVSLEWAKKCVTIHFSRGRVCGRIAGEARRSPGSEE